jgi:glyoxylase-like metal-dependent hydrolase (beta-lactamase superfamily II)/rhodanese-related sulfurtransferase
MEETKEVSPDLLRSWLDSGKELSLVDVRHTQDRAEWFIPGSISFNAYDKLRAHNPGALHGLHLDKLIPVVAICAEGKTSRIAAELLRQQGYQVFSLQGGMKNWTLSWNTAKISFANFDIIQLRRTGKGCLSYIIISKGEAIVVDASLPLENYQNILTKEKLSLKLVLETHVHADHLSRSKQVADYYKVPLYLPLPKKVNFDFVAVEDGAVITLGNCAIKAMHTPGHTIESSCYLIEDKVLLSGDTLFVEGVGRPDLKANEEEAVQKSKMLFQSLKKILALNQNIIVLPAHIGQPIDFDNTPIQATIEKIRQTVSLLKLNEEEFVNTILQHIPPTPDNYLSIVEKNIAGDFSDINPVDLEAGANRCAVS